MSEIKLMTIVRRWFFENIPYEIEWTKLDFVSMLANNPDYVITSNW